MQAAQKLAKYKLTQAINTALPAITDDIKSRLAMLMEEAAASDDEVKRVLDIFDNEENPIVFDFVESEAKPLAHKGFNVMIDIPGVQDMIMTVVPASFMNEYFEGLQIDVHDEIYNIATNHIREKI